MAWVRSLLPIDLHGHVSRFMRSAISNPQRTPL